MAATVVQDFSIASSTSSQTALTGGITDDTDPSYAITVTPIGGYSGSVSLSAPSGLPSGATPSAGATATFTPNPTSGSSTLKIDVGTSVTPKTYTVTVQGQATINGTTVTRSTQVTLIVQGSQPFQISGTVPNPLYPGAPAQSFSVTLTNPNSFAIHVTSLGVSVTAPNASACLPSWFKVTLQNATQSSPISVPGNGSVTTPATVQMLDVNQNQDVCKGQQLTLSYTGTYGK
jgi:hypothetical protein